MTKVALLNHGCAKNLVDSELMLGMLADAAFEEYKRYGTEIPEEKI